MMELLFSTDYSPSVTASVNFETTLQITLHENFELCHVTSNNIKHHDSKSATKAKDSAANFMFLLASLTVTFILHPSMIHVEN